MCVCAVFHSVIRLILQFLQENNLHSSLRALQEESQVGLASVDDVDKLAHNITHGSQTHAHIRYTIEHARHDT